jgi:hypothetical protein
VKVTFLVCGVDEHNHAHIFSVSHPGGAEVRNDPGYWAIGSGSHAALSLLSFFQQNVVRSLQRTIYNVFSAKLMAETSSLVGKNAFVYRLTPDGWDRNLSFDTFYAVRKEWDMEGKPRMPEGMEETIRISMTPKRSGSRKSKDQQ